MSFVLSRRVHTDAVEPDACDAVRCVDWPLTRMDQLPHSTL